MSSAFNTVMTSQYAQNQFNGHLPCIPGLASDLTGWASGPQPVPLIHIYSLLEQVKATNPGSPGKWMIK